MTDSKSWIFTDDEANLWLDSIQLSDEDLCLSGMSLAKRTLRDGRRAGVDIIEVDNGVLKFSVVPTRGMGLWKGSYRENYLGWISPVRGPVNPVNINLESRNGLGFLDGFDEWICRCGLSSIGAPGKDIISDHMGIPAEVLLPLHGKIANTSAHLVKVDSLPDQQKLQITGHIQESSMFGPSVHLSCLISTQPGSNRITLEDTITNISGRPAEIQILYHCNYGKPFLGEGARMLVPFSRMAPRDTEAAKSVNEASTYRKPTPEFAEQVFYYQPLGDDKKRSLSALITPGGDKAAVLRFDINQLPCFTQWKNTAAVEDGYVTAMEPGTSFPNPKTMERSAKRIVNLQPKQEYKIRLDLEIYDNPQSVKQITEEIKEIQRRNSKEVLASPYPEFQ